MATKEPSADIDAGRALGHDLDSELAAGPVAAR
jgi:hypothetical protein